MIHMSTIRIEKVCVCIRDNFNFLVGPAVRLRRSVSVVGNISVGEFI